MARLRGEAADGPRHLRTGRWGEQVAADHLQAQGLKILGCRVRVGRRDEIDLLARDGDTLVFVEVKTRADERFGRAAAAVDRAKRGRLSRAAHRYLRKLERPPRHFRFDIVEVIGEEDGPPPEVRHIRAAFAMDPRLRLAW
jgi:putative endonuclease